MSERYVGAWEQAGLFNPLNAPTGTPTYFPYLYSWGVNGQGQLGQGNTTSFSSPKQVGTLSNWSKVSGNGAIGGHGLSFAVKTDGTLWAWGSNNYGQLGLGTTTYYSSPKQIGALTSWLTVACGEYFAVAVRQNNTLWSWGYNNYGQLGLGTSGNYYSSPKQVGSLTNWLSVTCNITSVIATKTDGTLWSWGSNNVGQLGLGNTTSRSSPVQIGALSNWSSAVSTNNNSVIAIKTDGTIWSWGNNQFGQLGLGNITYYSSPKQIGALTNWKNIGCGYGLSLSSKTDGTLWSWGYNGQGQLGLGNTTSYSSPKQVGALTNWSNVFGNYTSGFAIKTDGTLWSWGSNNVGQLGLGNTTYYSSPKQVGASTTWLSITNGNGNSFALGLAY